MPERALFVSCLHSAVVFLLLAAPTFAQTSKIFQWKFSSDTLSNSLATCVSLPITVQPYNVTNTTGSSGVPPYYMMAFAVGGTPTTTLIGTDNKTLNWQPTHAPGTTLMLSVVDSTMSAGGVPPSLYTVIAGQSTQCVVNDDTNDFTVSSNVTGDITTCQPWGLRIKGGTPPYNVTFAAANSPIVTNVTMPFGDDAFTYIDRADPNTQLLAAISDLTGRWAKGTPIVSTKGSANVDCIGLVSSSGNSTDLDRQSSGSGTNKTAIIVGVVVPVVVLLILGAVFAWWFRRRRERQRLLIEPDVLPRQFEETGGQVLSITNFSNSSPPPSSKALVFNDTPYASNGPVRSASASSAAVSSTYYSSTASPQDDRGLEPNRRPNSAGRPGFAAFPSAPVRRTGKAAEAGSADADEEVVIQHRDGGAAPVRELPPPYADRNASGPSTS
ncbi:hypothetical protein BDQ17DRAFT_1371570 [Cyathus striatus]|nr:hypothetical protein BDQ17DRAFT_1371570 [Cyathus striatus]